MFCISAPRVFTSAISTARFYFCNLLFVFQRRAFLLPRSAPRVPTAVIYVLYFSAARFYPAILFQRHAHALLSNSHPFVYSFISRIS
jgi:hypothetical protein